MTKTVILTLGKFTEGKNLLNQQNWRPGVAYVVDWTLYVIQWIISRLKNKDRVFIQSNIMFNWEHMRVATSNRQFVWLTFHLSFVSFWSLLGGGGGGCISQFFSIIYIIRKGIGVILLKLYVYKDYWSYYYYCDYYIVWATTAILYRGLEQINSSGSRMAIEHEMKTFQWTKITGRWMFFTIRIFLQYCWNILPYVFLLPYYVLLFIISK